MKGKSNTDKRLQGILASVQGLLPTTPATSVTPAPTVLQISSQVTVLTPRRTHVRAAMPSNLRDYENTEQRVFSRLLRCARQLNDIVTETEENSAAKDALSQAIDAAKDMLSTHIEDEEKMYDD